MADDWWDRAGVLVSGAGALLVLGGLAFTACQIRDARRALEATTLYNVEKDYSDVFKPISTPHFQQCFGTESNHQGGISPPNVCEDQAERAHLYDILSNYRLMLDLEAYGSLDDFYVMTCPRDFGPRQT